MACTRQPLYAGAPLTLRKSNAALALATRAAAAHNARAGSAARGCKLIHVTHDASKNLWSAYTPQRAGGEAHGLGRDGGHGYWFGLRKRIGVGRGSEWHASGERVALCAAPSHPDWGKEMAWICKKPPKTEATGVWPKPYTPKGKIAFGFGAFCVL